MKVKLRAKLKKLAGNKNQKGFTLFELIIVISMAAVIMLVAIGFYSKARDGIITETFSKKIYQIMAGLTEVRLYKGRLSTGSTWPADTNTYVTSELRTEYAYSCAAGVLTLTTPSADDAQQVSRVLTRLIDQTICESNSSIVNSTQINCVPKGFNGGSGC